MIKGNPLKLMLQFALPLLLGNLLQQTALVNIFWTQNHKNYSVTA
jgi:hypothetical protein